MEAKQALDELGLLGSKETPPPPPLQAAPPPENQKPREWVYRDKNGLPVAVHGRWDTPTGKVIRWRLPDGDYKGSGLGDLKIEAMPLYGAELIKERPTDPVVFCEGESAVDACRENGLLAVTNGGGSSQQKFGSSLEILRNRKVELWPDNDPPGRILMNTIQEQLKPIAESVKILNVGKEMPFKGDAVQFFGDLKGTVEELRTYSEPVVEHLDYDRLQITVPLELSESGGVVTFLLENIASWEGSINALLTITPPKSPIHSQNYGMKRRVNLLSSSNIAAVVREAKNNFKDYDWGSLIPSTLALANKAVIDSEQNAPIDLASGMDYAVQEWLVSKLIPLTTNSIIFGSGASMKSIVLHSLALHVGIGEDWIGHDVEHTNQKILVLDYENSADTWKRQQRRLLDGMGLRNVWPEERITYLPMRGIALSLQMERLQRIIRENQIKFLIIDSAALAVDGDPIDTNVVTTYFNALQRLNLLGCTTITIAHIRQDSSLKENEAGTMKPFGSSFWTNSARATFYVEKEVWEGRSDTYTQIWKCRKFNFGYPPGDFTVRVKFADPEGAITIERE
tara:strand:+ start:3958 stop:5658 length:1701 start_codon:yes stop_codon:yes gene_type:complete